MERRAINSTSICFLLQICTHPSHHPTPLQPTHTRSNTHTQFALRGPVWVEYSQKRCRGLPWKLNKPPTAIGTQPLKHALVFKSNKMKSEGRECKMKKKEESLELSERDWGGGGGGVGELRERTKRDILSSRLGCWRLNNRPARHVHSLPFIRCQSILHPLLQLSLPWLAIMCTCSLAEIDAVLAVIAQTAPTGLSHSRHPFSL